MYKMDISGLYLSTNIEYTIIITTHPKEINLGALQRISSGDIKAFSYMPQHIHICDK